MKLNSFSNSKQFFKSFSQIRRFSSQKQVSTANVFDRNAKRLQRNRAALADDSRDYDYLKIEIADRLADRLLDIKDRKFEKTLDIGAGPGYLLPFLHDRAGSEKLIQIDMSEKMLFRDEEFDSKYNVKPERIVTDEEILPFEDNEFDLVISNLSLHWINDLPGLFAQTRNKLKPDGFFLASVFGEETLYQLRTSLLLATQERRGAVAQYLSPFAGLGDIGNLLTRTKFALPTVDSEAVTVRYGDIFALLRDLRGMAEGNCGWRRVPMIPREILVAADAIYKEMFPAPVLDDDDPNLPRGIEATFNIIYLGGWKEADNQQKPAKRGSQQRSLADL